MKSFIAVAVVILAIFALGSSKNIESKFADKDFMIKEKFMLEMFQHIYQDDVFVTKFDQTYYDYKPWDHLDDFNNVEILHSFFELWQHKPFYDDEIFTLSYGRHLEYAIGLTRMFFYAKDWNSFTHAVFWARLHCNKQLFVYSLTVVALHREDLEGIVLPAIYEIFPWKFFDVDTLEMAEKFKMHGFHNVKKLDNIYNVVIKSNYTNIYGNLNIDQKLTYFTEDIGLNAYYFYYDIDYPAWVKSDKNHDLSIDRRGELYLFVHRQMLARYYLERLSNDLGEIPYFDMYNTVATGYHSNLHYYQGVNMPVRDNFHNFNHNGNFEHMKDVHMYSMRIMDFIHKNKKDYMDVIDILGNMIQGNYDSIDIDYYGSLDSLYRLIVNDGPSYGKYYETLPSTLMYHATSLRDPLYYQIFKEILSYYWKFAETFPEYTTKDLIFEGVKIDKVVMPEHLTTYFEYFDADISNAVSVEVPKEGGSDALVNFGRNSHYMDHSYVIKARQLRLNHKPFDFELFVNSDKAQKAVVKVYIAPKYNEEGKIIHLENNYMNFYLLDNFLVDLIAGSNTIKRNSIDYTWYVHDRTTYLELYQKVMDATNTDYKFPLNQVEAHCGVPNRMMLPKGKKGGMFYQFFYMVYPYHETKVKQFEGFNPLISCGVGTGARFTDAMPFGFPFNRPVLHDYYFNVDNIKFHDIKIVHKDETTNTV